MACGTLDCAGGLRTTVHTTGQHGRVPGAQPTGTRVDHAFVRTRDEAVRVQVLGRHWECGQLVCRCQVCSFFMWAFPIETSATAVRTGSVSRHYTSWHAHSLVVLPVLPVTTGQTARRTSIQKKMVRSIIFNIYIFWESFTHIRPFFLWHTMALRGHLGGSEVSLA